VSNNLPFSLLAFADSLIPPLDHSILVSSLISSDSNVYVVKLRTSFLSEYSDFLVDFPFDSLDLKTYDELKDCLAARNISPEFARRFMSAFSELLLVACFSSPDILSSLRLLPSHLTISNVSF